MNPTLTTPETALAEPIAVLDDQPQQYLPRPAQADLIEAIVWRGDVVTLPTPWLAAGELTITANGQLIVHTLDGPRRVEIGDYVVRGVMGDYFPVPPHVFRAGYMEVATP